MKRVRFTRGFAAAVAIASIASGCGSDGNDDARDLGSRSVVESPAPVDRFVVTSDEIVKAGPDSPEGSLLGYWRDLQYQAWSDAAARYARGLRTYLGDDRLILALQNQAGRFRSSRPTDLETGRGVNEGTMVVRFLVQDTTKAVTPSSMTWVREGGEWRIGYDAFLDTALSQERQLAVQMQVAPTTSKPAAEALREGARARRLQAAYFAEQQDERKRARDPARP